MDDLHREHLLDHYENPRQQGTLSRADASFEDSNPLCGDQLRVQVQLSDDRTVLANAAFTGEGCIISQAAASMLLEDSVGKPVAAIYALEPQHVLLLLGMPLTAQRVKCALLSLKVLKGALLLAQQTQRADLGKS